MKPSRLFVSVMAACLVAGCGDSGPDGSTSSPAVPAPTPSPTPTPTPAPTPTPTATATPTSFSLTFNTPVVSALTDATSVRRVSDPRTVTDAQVVVMEPDAASTANFESLQLNGNESFHVRQQGEVGPYDLDFPASTFNVRNTANYYVGSEQKRVTPQLVWIRDQGTPASAQLVLPLLEEVRKTPATAYTTGNVPEHVQVVTVRQFEANGAPKATGFQLIGTPTTGAPTGTAATATFVGEAVGRIRLPNGVEQFIGDVVITVNYAAGTAKGTITVSQYAGTSTETRPGFTVTINASYSGNTFQSQSVDVKGEGIDESGALAGSFYGAQGDEIGLLLSSSANSGTSDTGNLILALVAGRE